MSKDNENPKLSASLKYLSAGLCVIPCKRDKTPYIKWTPYQEALPSEEDLRTWWTRWPNANLAVVTGKLSGLIVIDVDSAEGANSIRGYLEGSTPCPEVQTPKGRHLYYRYTDGLTTGAKILPGVDVRAEGGYVLAPPSMGYQVGGELRFWVPEDVPWMPARLHQALVQGQKQAFPEGLQHIDLGTQDQEPDIGVREESRHRMSYSYKTYPVPLLDAVKDIPDGERDVQLYHIALNLRYQGYSINQMTEALRAINAAKCKPPVEDEQVIQKVRQAMKNKQPREIGKSQCTMYEPDVRSCTTEVQESTMANRIREWVEESQGWFKAVEITDDLMLDRLKGRRQVHDTLYDMVKKGKVLRHQTKHGFYRRIKSTSVRINFLEEDMTPKLKIISPMNLTQHAVFAPGQIYLVAGITNSGKTTWCVNIAKDNAKIYKVYYFNMESGKEEMRRVLERCPDVDIKWWMDNVEFREPEDKDQTLGDLIIPGQGVLNIIDYLSPPGGDYSLMERAIEEIFIRLDGAMCVVALQQWPDANHPAGGQGTLSRCRFAIALMQERQRAGRNYVKILKDKVMGSRDGEVIYFDLDWKNNLFIPLPVHTEDYNPRGRSREMTGEGILFERSE